MTQREESPRFLALGTDPLSRGGIGIYTLQFLAGLARGGPNSRGRLVTFHLHEDDALPAGWTASCAKRRTTYIARTLLSAITDRPSELVVFHIFLMPVAVIAALLTGARITVVVYGWDVSRNTRLLNRVLGNCADRMVAISRRTA